MCVGEDEWMRELRLEILFRVVVGGVGVGVGGVVVVVVVVGVVVVVVVVVIVVVVVLLKKLCGGSLCSDCILIFLFF
jgi:hypothetical protein